MSRKRDRLDDRVGDLDDVSDIEDFDVPDVPDAPEGIDVPDAVEQREADDAAGDGAAGAGDGAAGTAPTSRVSRDIYDVVGRARPQKIAPAASGAGGPAAADPAEDEAGNEGEDAAPTEVFATGDGGQADDGYRLPESADAADGAAAVTADETATTAFAGTPAAYTDPGPVYESPFDENGGYVQADGSAGSQDVAADDGDNETRVFAPAGAAGAAGAVGAAGAAAAAGDGYDGYDETYGAVPVPQQEAEEADRAAADEAASTRRGTLDLGLLILRLVAGVLLGLRGVQTLFAFGGDPGIDSLEQVLGSYDGAQVLAIALPVAELVGGVLLLLGLLTPVGGAVALVSASFMALHYLSGSGAEYWPYQLDANAQAWAFLAVLGLVLVFTGPGRYAVDGSRGWATRPRASAWLWAVIGLAGAAALWILVGGGNPF
ncbi:DoxX family membrane protein [Corynebacterium nuruki]|uniref:DoxX family membrane protein n=1 Tax=Corynebacterium nuruki TaxID=1032851 RepID=UPI0002486603|nr:DoxX family membrane protein [Corynebacterium nuruki]